jgi:alanine dehydrogenase
VPKLQLSILTETRLAYLDDLFNGRAITLMSNSYNVGRAVKEADLVIGAVLIPGARTPRVVTEEMVKSMKPGSVLVDVAVDQGGCIETIDRSTTLENPYYIKYGVVHYSVGNMPGAVPPDFNHRTDQRHSALHPGNCKQGSGKGYAGENSALRKGLNVYKGKLTIKGAADAQGLEYTPSEELF